jgi:PAS domain S-box-containing protein
MNDHPSDPPILGHAELTALVDAAPVGMAVFGSDRRYRFVNATLARLNNRPAAEHIGRLPSEVLSFGRQVEEALQRVLAGEASPLRQTLEGRRTTDAGVPRRYRASYWPLVTADGGVSGVSGVGSLVLDVTEHAEAELALTEMEAGYRGVIEAANDAILIADARTGALLDANQRAATLLGRSLDELLGMSQRDLHPPEEAEIARNIFAEHSSSGGAINSGIHVLHADGHRVPVEISGSPMRYRGREAVLGLFRDVTQRRRQQEMLERANRELRKLDEMKNNLLANVSHELRSPLVGIRGYVELMRGGPPARETQQKWVDRILRNIARLERIIDGLLQMTALHAGLWPQRTGPVPVSRLVDSALATVKPQARNSDIDLVVEVPADLPAVLGDETQLTSVVINLLENAIKFSAEGSEVRLTAREVGAEEVAVRVEDQGVGIAPEHLEQIFERFFQVDSSSTRAYGGFGVGLAIVKEVIDAHGGTVRVDSELQQGTTVDLTLPRAPARDSHPQLIESGNGEPTGSEDGEPTGSGGSGADLPPSQT